MAFKLEVRGQNQTLLYTDKATILFSYNTPVAALIHGHGYVKTAHIPTPITTKHIEAWLGGIILYEIVDQSVLDDLLT